MRDFSSRHIGPDKKQIDNMLSYLGEKEINQFIKKIVPESIYFEGELNLPAPLSEEEALKEITTYAKQNQIFRSYLGLGYYNNFTPKVIQRTILENPCWYTQYTPYQAEIAQGRLEALLNFQTMVCDLTGMELANASLLDEATAVAEAVTMIWRVKKQSENAVFAIHSGIHPNSLQVLKTRSEPLNIKLKIFTKLEELADVAQHIQGIVIQSPDTYGEIIDLASFSKFSKDHDAALIVASDLLYLCKGKSPGEYGADVVVGNSQRFGVPLGYGGPHAAFFATKTEYQREIPGRLVGVSKDITGKPALRLALQTREQHIRRERATSNICTAQVLLAIMSSMYAVYHGPSGLKNISDRVHNLTAFLAKKISDQGLKLRSDNYFDTLTMDKISGIQRIIERALAKKINLRYISPTSISLSLDETTSLSDLEDLFFVITGHEETFQDIELKSSFPKDQERTTKYLQAKVFNSHHSETELLRYITKLQGRDLSLAHSMIPLGSCTMKLNAASEMMPVSYPEFGNIHPFAPTDQASGYQKLFKDLESWIGDITGLPAVSLQPNAGSQGEYAGLMVIREYFKSKGESRDVCIIPSSAHGTNPASAQMAGMKVVVTKCDESGNIDLEDIKAKVFEHKGKVAALMVTYPSTHGVFESGIKSLCEIIHEEGGLVYMDGANLNAQVGVCKAGQFGADVCHLNLHKTFCIPHGGGGPGMGPIAGREFLREFLPGHNLMGQEGSGSVSGAPYGSALILVIPWMYMRMMGGESLKYASQVAILNANYVAKRLKDHFPILYTGANGYIAHECILDLRNLKRTVGIEVIDVAKRLIDFGFHAPTVSFPVAETLMIEPTESESIEELDYFCDAMIQIKKEIDQVANGTANKENNLLKNSPHTVDSLVSEWSYPYSKEEAVYPLPWVKERKFWPYVARIDNAYGDRNLFCSCEMLTE